MRFSQLFFRFAHLNCLIFGTKLNLGNTYMLEIFILFEQFLIPIIPFIFLKMLNNAVFRLFFRLVQNCFQLKEQFSHLENLFQGKNEFFWFFLITIFRKFAERRSTARLLKLILSKFHLYFGKKVKKSTHIFSFFNTTSAWS